MFDNIGSKIKTISVIACFLGLILSVVLGFIVMSISKDLIFLGFATMIFMGIVSWISAIFIYGYGELIEETTKNRKNTDVIASLLNRLIKSAQTSTSSSEKTKIDAPITESKTKPIKKEETTTFTVVNNEKIVCDNCNTEQPNNRYVCWNCGRKFEIK